MATPWRQRPNSPNRPAVTTTVTSSLPQSRAGQTESSRANAVSNPNAAQPTTASGKPGQLLSRAR